MVSVVGAANLLNQQKGVTELRLSLSVNLDPYTKEGWSCYTFFCIQLGQGRNVRVAKQSTGEIQRSQTVKTVA